MVLGETNIVWTHFFFVNPCTKNAILLISNMAASSNGFGLITILSFITLIKLLAILNTIDGGYVSNHQSNAAYEYKCVCVWMLRNECPWNNRHFMTWKVAHPWWGSNPWSLDYIPSSTDNCHVSDHQSNAYQIYVCISGALNQKNCIRKWKQSELQMSDDSHFEFYDLWENGAIYSLAYGRNGFSTNNSYRNNKWSTFPQKCLQVFTYFSISIFQFFDLTIGACRPPCALLWLIVTLRFYVRVLLSLGDCINNIVVK